MNSQKNDKKFVFWSIVILFIVVILFLTIMLVFMWLGYGQFNDRKGNPIEPAFGIRLMFTIIFVVALVVFAFISRWMFRYQEKLDTQHKQIHTK